MQGVLRLFLSLVLGCAVLAYDLSVRKTPRGKLGVALDYSLALKYPEVPPGQTANDGQRRRNWFLSSHIAFNNEISEITDGQLWQIAEDAFNEMMPEIQQYGIDRRPNAMGLIAVGKELILTSSQSGDVQFAYNLAHDSLARKYLQICHTIWVDGGNKDRRHKFSGKCSEIMAAHLYSLHHNDYLIVHNARVVTMTWDFGKRAPKRTPPCGDDSVGVNDRPVDWGCNLFVHAMKLKPVPTSTPSQKYELNDLAGGVVKKGQIQLCGDYIENRPPTPTPTESIEEGQR